MRKFSLAAVAVGTLASVGMTPSPVQARDYPFCIKGDDFGGGIGDCSFDSYKQCLATASGRKAYCDVNPFYASPKQSAVAYPKNRRRHY
jgi:hypothetical protein